MKISEAKQRWRNTKHNVVGQRGDYNFQNSKVPVVLKTCSSVPWKHLRLCAGYIVIKFSTAFQSRLFQTSGTRLCIFFACKISKMCLLTISHFKTIIGKNVLKLQLFLPLMQVLILQKKIEKVIILFFRITKESLGHFFGCLRNSFLSQEWEVLLKQNLDGLKGQGECFKTRAPSTVFYFFL